MKVPLRATSVKLIIRHIIITLNYLSESRISSARILQRVDDKKLLCVLNTFMRSEITLRGSKELQVIDKRRPVSVLVRVAPSKPSSSTRRVYTAGAIRPQTI